MFIVLSLFTLYLFLAGYVATSFARSRGRLFEQLALTIGLGMLINHCLVLTGLTLTWGFITGAMLAFWGLLKLFADLRARSANTFREWRASVSSVLCMIYLLVVYYVEILSEPLLHWDARSIWFLHAKMIWAEGALRRSAGWNHPSLKFSNPDYPKLVPAIAAQLAHLKGYWNDFVPKGSLVVMLLPLMLWVFSFRQKSVSFVFLVLIFFFSLDAWLWNATMDGYLILYCGATLLLLGRYLSEGRDTDLYSSMCSLGIAASIKNEALLFALCLAAALLLIGRRHSGLSLGRLTKRVREDFQFSIVLLLSVAPTVMWTMCKKAWGLQSDLARDPSASLSRLSDRLYDGVTPRYLLSYLTVRATAIWVLAALLAAAAIFSVSQRMKVHSGALVAATTAALYFCGLCFVYLTTPSTLAFFLPTSATRTMTTASVAVLVSLFFFLSELEAHQDRI